MAVPADRLRRTDEALVEDPGLYPWLGYLDAELGTLFMYLPALGAWAGLAMLVASMVRRVPTEPARPGTCSRAG